MVVTLARYSGWMPDHRHSYSIPYIQASFAHSQANQLRYRSPSRLCKGKLPHVIFYSALSSDVQFGHRVAFMEIFVKLLSLKKVGYIVINKNICYPINSSEEAKLQSGRYKDSLLPLKIYKLYKQVYKLYTQTRKLCIILLGFDSKKHMDVNRHNFCIELQRLGIETELSPSGRTEEKQEVFHRYPAWVGVVIL